jgi:hypothetical protein
MKCQINVGQEACNIQTLLVCGKVSSTFGSLLKLHLVDGIDLFLFGTVGEVVM